MLRLPESMREEVRKPFGRIIQNLDLENLLANASRPLISVGDRCTIDLIDAKILPDISIFDFKIQRVEVGQEIKEKLAGFVKDPFLVLSPPGHITEQLIEAVKAVLSNKKGFVLVIGEEDLAALVVMAQAKTGTLVYGQPNAGMVVVELGPEVAENAARLISRMEKV
ncbi:MAG: DUF359 domain-containing protein [Candidatus Anstonellaceae archaeon]